MHTRPFTEQTQGEWSYISQIKQNVPPSFSNLIMLKPCGTSLTNVLEFSGLNLLGDNSPSHFCIFHVSFSSEVPYVMVVSQIDVEDRDHVCFWGRGQICFLIKIIKIMSPSGFARGPFKGLRFFNLRIS